MDSFLPIPIFALAIGAPLFIFSLRYNEKICILSFVSIILFFILGTDVLVLLFTFLAIYSIGFWFSFLFVRVESYGPLNLVIGFISLYIPVFLLTVLTSYPGVFGAFPIMLQRFFVNTQTLSVITCIVGLVCSLSLFSFKKQQLLSKFANFNSVLEDVNPISFILIFLLMVVISYVAMPTIGYDDLAIHSYIQNHVANGEYPSFDISVNVWSYAQWVSNIYYGLMGGYTNGEGRTLLNLFLVLTIVLMSFSVLRSYLLSNFSLLIITLALSTPLFILSLTNSQSELISTLLLVSIFYCFFKYKSGTFLKALFIFSFAVAIKPSNALLFFFPFVLFSFTEFKQYGIRTLKQVNFYFSLILSTFIAFSAYIFAFAKTGNPVYPLFNEIFKASGFPAINFFNGLYVGNFGLDAFLGVIFNTSKYLESKDGVAGFQLLILPVVIVSIPFLYKRAKKEILFFSAITISALALFYSQQYVRYISPSIFVLTLVVALLFSRLVLSRKILLASTYALISGLIAYNFAHVNNVIWYFPGWKAEYFLLTSQNDRFVSDHEPILQVNNYLNALRGDVNVVYPVQKPFASNLQGNYIYLNWYNTEGSNAFSKGSEELYRYVASKRATHIITLSGVNDALLNVAKEHGKLVYQNMLYDVYEIDYSNRALEGEVSYFGNVTLNPDKSFSVDTANFVLYEYGNLDGGNRFRLEYELICPESGVWKDYIEFDRYTNFSNMIRTYNCSNPGVKQHHTFEFYAPYLTKEIRVFVQPIIGEYKILSVNLSELSND